jgi:hypothetical protein
MPGENQMAAAGVLVLLAWIGFVIMNLSPLSSTRGAPRDDNPPARPTFAEHKLAATAHSSSRTTDAPLGQYRALLSRAEEQLRQVSGYTATFVQQVRKGDRLLDAEEIQIKVRHEPFSVYMDFGEKGLQVLYVDGANDGRLVARKTRGLLQRTLRLEPTGRIAMRTNRQPVTQLGLLGLVLMAERIMDACPRDSGIQCEIASAEVAGEPVRQFTVTFAAPSVQKTYSKCRICFKAEEPIPVCISCYGWKDDGQPGELIEYYSYRDVHFDAVLADVDFDPENASYAFRN